MHFLSIEFLLGRTLRINMMNLAAEPIVRHAIDWFLLAGRPDYRDQKLDEKKCAKPALLLATRDA